MFRSPAILIFVLCAVMFGDSLEVKDQICPLKNDVDPNKTSRLNPKDCTYEASKAFIGENKYPLTFDEYESLAEFILNFVDDFAIYGPSTPSPPLSSIFSTETTPKKTQERRGGFCTAKAFGTTSKLLVTIFLWVFIIYFLTVHR